MGDGRALSPRHAGPRARPRPSERKSVPPLKSGDVYLCSPGFEGTLRDELGPAFKRATTEPGLVITPVGPPLVDPAFSRQVLPRARRIEAVGPSELADTLLKHLGDDEEALLSGRALLHLFPPDFLRRGSARPEPHPLSSAVQRLGELLTVKIEGRARKRGVAPAEGGADRLVQVLLVEGWVAWCSVAPLSTSGAALTSWPARFSGGHAPVEGYDDAPSSAYRKLVEALAWLERRPGDGDVVLDLGAAPGGWSYVALDDGARVIAYDRADMDPRLARHDRLTHVRQDAFANAPLSEATWLLCDVIDLPERSLGLIEQALACDSLRGLVVTVKLKPPIAVAPVKAARALLDGAVARGWIGRVKHLVHNKHEVTVMARRADVAGPSRVALDVGR